MSIRDDLHFRGGMSVIDEISRRSLNKRRDP
jgi:hypothetical protein